MWGGISPVDNDLEWQSEGKRHQKWVSLFRQSLTLPRIYLVWRFSIPFLSLTQNYFVCLRFFPFSLPFDLWSGILPFLFYFSFLYFHLFLFLSFHLFLFFLFTSPSPSLCLGNRVLAFYSLSLEEIPLSFASGKEWGFFFIGQGSKRSKVVSPWGLLSWEPQSWYLGRNKFGCQGVDFGPNFHIIP